MIFLCEFAKLLKYLAYHWHSDAWMTHSLDNRRNEFVARIRQAKGE